MMKNLRSRNFTTYEVTHRPEQLPTHLDPVAYFLQGVLQTIRDYLTIKYKREIRINIISGYRPPAVNASTTGAAEHSNHIWDDTPVKCAADIYSPDIDHVQLYIACKSLIRGEVYVDHSQRKVHIAPCGPVKKPWEQP